MGHTVSIENSVVDGAILIFNIAFSFHQYSDKSNLGRKKNVFTLIFFNSNIDIPKKDLLAGRKVSFLAMKRMHLVVACVTNVGNLGSFGDADSEQCS